MSAEMSINAYARYRNCNPYTVQVAIKNGRISLNSNKKIDPTEADRMWAANTNSRMNTRGKDSPHRGAVKGASPSASFTGPSDPSATSAGKAPNFSDARAFKEHYAARLMKLEFEEKAGQLVSGNEVKVQTFNRFRAFRDQMLNIPDRIADQLASIVDAQEIFRILTEEIHSALNQSASDSNG